MNYSNMIEWTAPGLQLGVAVYALRLNRLFGASRVGWLLFEQFLNGE